MPSMLGIDSGSVAVSAVKTDSDGKILDCLYRFHQGQVRSTLEEMFRELDLSDVESLAVTSSTPVWLQSDIRCDNQVALIRAKKELHPEAAALLFVGGEKFGLLRFDGEGNYSSLNQNTSCAAGTGSFLDQQAGRLNLSGIEEFCSVASSNKDSRPQIASRCAVFAKTDLIHAQQEGFSLSAICDGLSLGLAKNLVDTLFSGKKIQGDLVFCGGVSRNLRVSAYIEELTGLSITSDEYSPFYGAYGAVLELLSQQPEKAALLDPETLFLEQNRDNRRYSAPLEMELSTYPDFQSEKSYLQQIRGELNPFQVEVDIYHLFPREIECTLGVDIGSTSTKAVLLAEDGRVMAGFYTATSGRPLQAVKGILESIKVVERESQSSITIARCGTTGSGRKFIGKIIGSDLMLDEITAHARAAYELDPEVDTIIEIGGQDSKFTTLHRGIVTSSIMNNVCAAGTGSFLEEQAKKMNCPVSDYATRTMGTRAPASSDRCTVFMERDMNHFLNDGCTVNEVLASAIHSVRENYLQKVVAGSSIGEKIYFQGATARNKALVAAFEQKLQKPIMVSRYCHLTGALGVALKLQDQKKEQTLFRGVELYRMEIPVEQEVCQLCGNHCKISLATIGGEKVAYGFLCGRDYETQKFVNNNSSGFDLLKERKKTFVFPRNPAPQSAFTIGIPYAMQLVDEWPLWEYFFHRLGIKTRVSRDLKNPVQKGKIHSEAEFCAPVTALHGHADYLLNQADYLFMPFYMEKKKDKKQWDRKYCYYTQFAPTLIRCHWKSESILTPLLGHNYSSITTKTELHRMLCQDLGWNVSLLKVSSLFDEATAFYLKGKESLRTHFDRDREDIQVVLLGRPYTILSEGMNKGIPDIFGSLGVKVYNQEMLPPHSLKASRIESLLEEIHWNYAASIMESAETISTMEGVYPVLVTSFKCSPDSYIKSYMKKMLEGQNKPYLVLELDEHDSAVGYETRIEAAVRAFRNHARQEKKPERLRESINPRYVKKLKGKNLLMPNWDPISGRFLTAILQKEGIRSYLMEETEESIRRSLSHNSGQCIPMNAIAQGVMDCVEKEKLNPAKTVFWMARTRLSCNIPLYSYHIQTILREYGGGLEKVQGYMGDLSFVDISPFASLNAYLAFMFAGYIRRMSCRIRPYERIKGETDRSQESSIQSLLEFFAGRRKKEQVLEEIVSLFEGIEVDRTERPKVAIFGDFYVRDNPVMNQNLIHFIEEQGGEVITTPFTEYAKIIAETHFKRLLKEKRFGEFLLMKPLFRIMQTLEKSISSQFSRILTDPEFSYHEHEEQLMKLYGLRLEQSGESSENILKIYHLKRHFPDISLFVQTNPAFCCAGLVTEAMRNRIEEITKVPTIAITYDGTGGNKNEAIIPYLRFARKNRETKRNREDKVGAVVP